MTYLQIAPSPVLRPLLRSLWYCRAPHLPHSRERVLPNGCLQIILNLAGNHLTNCSGTSPAPYAPAIIVGASGHYDVLDTADLAELVGIVVEPGGFARLFRERADLFFGQSIDLASLWPRFEFISQLAEASTPAHKLRVLDALLQDQLRVQTCRSVVVNQAIQFLHHPRTSVSACAQSIGLSERRLSQVFREEVGLSPKLWYRIQRFQAALHHLHRGTEIPWVDLAMNCGYYDQAHFINDFRAFAGINPTTYSVLRGQWRNHVPLP